MLIAFNLKLKEKFLQTELRFTLSDLQFSHQ